MLASHSSWSSNQWKQNLNGNKGVGALLIRGNKINKFVRTFQVKYGLKSGSNWVVLKDVETRQDMVCSLKKKTYFFWTKHLLIILTIVVMFDNLNDSSSF